MFKVSRLSVVGRRVAAVALASGMISLVLVVLAPSAFAVTKTKLGQTKENYLCSSSDQWIQTASSGPSYVVPAGDTKIKKWSTNGGAAAGTMQFEVWAPAGGNDYKLVYISPQKILKAGKISVVFLSTAIKVVAGDVIGYRAVSEADCALETGKSADTYLYDPSSSAPTVGSTVAFSGPATGFKFNISAVAK